GGSGAPGQAVPAAQPVDRHGRSGLPSCRRGGPTDGAAGGLTPRCKQASAAKPSAAPGWRFPKLLPTWDMQKCGVENEHGTSPGIPRNPFASAYLLGLRAYRILTTVLGSQNQIAKALNANAIKLANQR